MYVDISFQLPSEEDLQSAGGVEFSTDQSRIYIPYSAIQHQKETEGTAAYIRMHTITTNIVDHMYLCSYIKFSIQSYCTLHNNTQVLKFQL